MSDYRAEPYTIAHTLHTRPILSRLRLRTGSDAIVFLFPTPKPNWFVRLMVHVVLGMEWMDAS